jgi:hypothetical protein
MGVSYHDLSSPLVHESAEGIWKAGYRCPDVLIASYESANPSRLYSKVSYGKFVVLFIGQPRSVPEQYNDLATALVILPPTRKEDDTGQPVKGIRDSAGLSAHGGVFNADWVAENDCLSVVIRPDMYIGYAGVTEQGWLEYLDMIFFS